MKKNSTSNELVKERETLFSPKSSTITFLMNFARVYNSKNKAVSSAGEYYLN